MAFQQCSADSNSKSSGSSIGKDTVTTSANKKWIKGSKNQGMMMVRQQHPVAAVASVTLWCSNQKECISNIVVQQPAKVVMQQQWTYT